MKYGHLFYGRRCLLSLKFDSKDTYSNMICLRMLFPCAKYPLKCVASTQISSKIPATLSISWTSSCVIIKNNGSKLSGLFAWVNPDLKLEVEKCINSTKNSPIFNVLGSYFQGLSRYGAFDYYLDPSIVYRYNPSIRYHTPLFGPSFYSNDISLPLQLVLLQICQPNEGPSSKYLNMLKLVLDRGKHLLCINV